MTHQREVRIRLSKDGMRVIGTGRWAEPGDSWMMAHDLLHHHPDDHGTVGQELQTFGAQLWLEVGPQHDEPPSFDESQISMLWLEGPGGFARDFRVREAPGRPRFVPPAHRPFLTELVQRALKEAADELFRSSPAEFEVFTNPEHQQALLSWIALGYARARKRYPERKAAQALFQRLREWLWLAYPLKHPSSGTLRFVLDEQALTFTPLDALGRKAFQRLEDIVRESELPID